ncbi:MAG: lytic transglycosylase domain-containing protein, partial [Acetobacteraceae bacterium]
MRRLAALAFLLTVLAACPAAAENPMPAVRGNLWTEAAADAAQYADPVAAKLVTFYRLLDPGAAGPAEIASFMAANPDWPFQALLRERLELALETTADDGVVRQFCEQYPPRAALALLRCAQAELAGGDDTRAYAEARKAWIDGDFSAAKEQAVLARWGDHFAPGTEWQRFANLVAIDLAGAQRQLARLEPREQAAGKAWLALARGKNGAWESYASLPAAARREPGLFLAAMRWLEQQGYRERAVRFWQKEGDPIEAAAPEAERPAFWNERDILARDLLQVDQPKPAYALVAAPPAITRRDALSQQFLAGFIALRWLHAPSEAIPHFQALADASPAVITQGRAHYWLGRAEEAAGDRAAAGRQYRAAAKWLTSYYGQLAVLALGASSAELDQKIRALRDPSWTPGQALRFASREVTRAAAFLVAWGAPRRARAFILRLVELAPDPAMRALA